MMAIQYKHLRPNRDYHSIGDLTEHKVVLIIASGSDSEWQAALSEDIVKNGCKYVMAWGDDCSSWDDSVDIANLEQHDFGDIPEQKSVMTTWHEEESLEDVFWFCEYSARHPTQVFRHTTLIHISDEQDEKEMLSRYETATAEP